MPNILGWTPNGGDDTKVRELLCITKPPTVATFNLHLPADQIPRVLFDRFFMPYAENHFAYDGATCNCEDLAQAFGCAYLYVKKLLNDENITTQLPLVNSTVRVLADKVRAIGFIAKPLRAVGGLAQGNVRLRSGQLDGRCYFPNHTICQIGNLFYDPTFGYISNTKEECIQREMTSDGLGVLKFSNQQGRNLPQKILIVTLDCYHCATPGSRRAMRLWR